MNLTVHVCAMNEHVSQPNAEPGGLVPPSSTLSASTASTVVVIVDEETEDDGTTLCKENASTLPTSSPPHQLHPNRSCPHSPTDPISDDIGSNSLGHSIPGMSGLKLLFERETDSTTSLPSSPAEGHGFSHAPDTSGEVSDGAGNEFPEVNTGNTSDVGEDSSQTEVQIVSEETQCQNQEINSFEARNESEVPSLRAQIEIKQALGQDADPGDWIEIEAQEENKDVRKRKAPDTGAKQLRKASPVVSRRLRGRPAGTSGARNKGSVKKMKVEQFEEFKMQFVDLTNVLPYAFVNDKSEKYWTLFEDRIVGALSPLECALLMLEFEMQIDWEHIRKVFDSKKFRYPHNVQAWLSQKQAAWRAACK